MFITAQKSIERPMEHGFSYTCPIFAMVFSRQNPWEKPMGRRGRERLRHVSGLGDDPKWLGAAHCGQAPEEGAGRNFARAGMEVLLIFMIYMYI